MEKIEALEKIVGAERVVVDEDILKGFQTDASFVAGESPECLVKPRNMADVQALVNIANEKKWPLVPCSSQGQRFNGDTVPQAAGSIIVDLSGMKTIVRVDKRNKVAMVEPGVTFEQLIDAVEKEGLRVEMPMIPKKGKSVVASLLDREPTTAPKYNWDGIDPLCCLELIFGTGDFFRTGNSAGPGTLEQQWASGQAQKISMGPAQTDLARVVQGAQGTIGIATWATVKLEIKPSMQRGFLVGADKPEDLIDFTYKLLWRKLPDVCLLLNNTDLTAIYGIDGTGLPSWNLVYSLSGLEYLPEERLQYMEADIADIAKDFKLMPKQNIAGVSANKLVEIITRPGNDPYWKTAGRGASQDLFFLTTLDRSPAFIKAVEAEAEASGFSQDHLGVYIQPIRHGTGCHLEFNLMYDPADSVATETVRALFDSAGQRCLEMGGFFSRPHQAWADMVYSKSPDYARALKKVKNIFDPNGVMNPGKLCFGKEV